MAAIALESLWSALKQDPSDFAAWTALVIESEKSASPEPLRKALEGFLAEWPLCYGYWARLADHEMRCHGEAASTAVFERALTAGCTQCVELWSLYASHAHATHSSEPELIRGLFERALAAVGSAYNSDALWDRYISFESSVAERAGTDHAHVAALYRRVLAQPVRSLDSYWTRLQEFATAHPGAELCDAPTEAALRAELSAHGACPKVNATQADDDGARRLRVLPLLEARYRLTKRSHGERLRFEAAVRRRHFHVRPLEESELRHWGRYLSWEEAQLGERQGEAALQQLVLTYERCLVPCCLSASIWLRYARTLEARGSVELARAVLRRASGTFLKRHVGVLLAHAEFDEAHGCVAAARELCAAAAAVRPPSLEAVVTAANLERRAAEWRRMREIFTDGLARFEGEELTFLARHAAKLERTAGEHKDSEYAAQIFESSLKREPANVALWEGALEHEIETLVPPGKAPRKQKGAAAGAAATADGLTRLSALFERMVAEGSSLSWSNKQRAWRKYVKCLRDHSSSVAHVRRLELTHLVGKRLREAEEGGGDDSDQPPQPTAPAAAAPSEAAAAQVTAAAAMMPKLQPPPGYSPHDAVPPDWYTHAGQHYDPATAVPPAATIQTAIHPRSDYPAYTGNPGYPGYTGYPGYYPSY